MGGKQSLQGAIELVKSNDSYTARQTFATLQDKRSLYPDLFLVEIRP